MSEIFVTCAGGLEPLLIEELQELGIHTRRKGFRGVYVEQSMQNVYRINYLSRLATRVLWPLAQFKCPDKDALYQAALAIDWSQFLDEETTFAIDANVSHPNLRNSHYAALVVKDAICDQLRDKIGARPSIDLSNPAIQLNLFIHNGRAVLSFDTSGIPLYKRGWRLQNTQAPLQETLAAAILRHVHYTPNDLLVDPFCGSGTFLIEAAMLATQTPAGYFRKSWGFTALPDFSVNDWLQVKQTADQKRKPLPPGIICGADNDPTALKTCQSHLKNTGFDIPLAYSDIKAYQPPIKPTVIVTNPPYGKRLDASIDTYRALGQFVQCPSFVLASDDQLIRKTGCRFKPILSLSNGGLPVSLFELRG